MGSCGAPSLRWRRGGVPWWLGWSASSRSRCQWRQPASPPPPSFSWPTRGRESRRAAPCSRRWNCTRPTTLPAGLRTSASGGRCTRALSPCWQGWPGWSLLFLPPVPRVKGSSVSGAELLPAPGRNVTLQMLTVINRSISLQISTNLYKSLGETWRQRRWRNWLW